MCSNVIVSKGEALSYGTPVTVKTPQAFRMRKIQMQEGNKKAMKKLTKASILTTVFIIVQFTGALYAGSIALMADTAHLATDLIGFSISVASLLIAQKPASESLSFGYHRAEVLGTLISMLVLWAITIFLVYAATLRFIDPPEIVGNVMFVTAVLGLFFNLIQMSILDSVDEPEAQPKEDQPIQVVPESNPSNQNPSQPSTEKKQKETKNKKQKKSSKVSKDLASGSAGLVQNLIDDDLECPDKHIQSMSSSQSLHIQDEQPRLGLAAPQQAKTGNLNVESAYLHVLGDMLMSVGVIVAAVIIYFWPSAKIADPICTYLFSVIVATTSFPVVKECVKVLMEGTPTTINIEDLKNELYATEGVEEIHDFHLWSISMGKFALSCHIKSDKPFKTLSLVTDLCRKNYSIYHTTIQMEVFSNSAFNLKCENDLHE